MNFANISYTRAGFGILRISHTYTCTGKEFLFCKYLIYTRTSESFYFENISYIPWEEFRILLISHIYLEKRFEFWKYLKYTMERILNFANISYLPKKGFWISRISHIHLEKDFKFHKYLIYTHGKNWISRISHICLRKNFEFREYISYMPREGFWSSQISHIHTLGK